jgi:polyferredoxin
LLLGGVVLATLMRGKNPYCSWFCPFGAVQECLASVGGAKPYRPVRFYARLKWLQRGLAFAAITLGLALRQPAATSYEPFGTLFSLSGGFFPWMLLVIILFSSLIIRRPFCSYLCPIDPVIELIGRLRGWLLEQWSTKRTPRTVEPPSSF